MASLAAIAALAGAAAHGVIRRRSGDGPAPIFVIGLLDRPQACLAADGAAGAHGALLLAGGDLQRLHVLVLVSRSGDLVEERLAAVFAGVALVAGLGAAGIHALHQLFIVTVGLFCDNLLVLAALAALQRVETVGFAGRQLYVDLLPVVIAVLQLVPAVHRLRHRQKHGEDAQGNHDPNPLFHRLIPSNDTLCSSHSDPAISIFSGSIPYFSISASKYAQIACAPAEYPLG